MTSVLRRDPLRALRLIFLACLLVSSVGTLAQIAWRGAGSVWISGGLLLVLFLLRLLESRRDRLGPAVVDLVDVGAIAVLLLEAGSMDMILAPIFFGLFTRALIARPWRYGMMVAGYFGTLLGVSLAAHVPMVLGGLIALPVAGTGVYGMRALLSRLREQLADVLNGLPFPVLLTGAQGEVLLANPAAYAFTGPFEGLRVTGADGSPVDVCRLPAGESGLELHLSRADGTSAVAVADTVANPRGTIVTLRDVTEQRDFERRLRHAAEHDMLTGLPNRALLWRRFEAADSSYAVLLLDLDGFKAINDTYGHLAGDELLCRVADRLRDVCGPEATVARLGGDEFAVLVPGSGRERAEAVAEGLERALAREVPLATGPVRVGGSIGYAMGAPGRSPDEVLAEADAAMYHRKHSRSPADRLVVARP
ncbi:diguanylate cyclase domain-containing protein [Actinoplanes sp. CA-030573]|uniref:diguanylate cyclase domain-containing protein n=1 Tax=Actinoplanes sp. CA-030573 TaxID=3239898 RepID=UPI003D8F8B24